MLTARNVFPAGITTGLIYKKHGVREDNHQYPIWFDTERLTLLSTKIDNKVIETENRSRGLTNLITVYQNVIEEEMGFSFDQTT